MASPDAIPEAAKARTLSHMNKEHSTDLQHMLQHFNGLSASAAANPALVDMDLSSLTLAVPSAQGPPTTHVIKLSPPMAKWDDRRQRLIDMTMAAREALGVVTTGDHADTSAPIVVREYRRPVGVHWVVFFAVLHYIWCVAVVRAGLVQPGSVLWDFHERFFPGGAAAFLWLVDAIFYPVLAIHLTEAWWHDRTRLSAHGVVRGSRVWCMWIGSCLIEGAMSFKRFDALVEELKEKRAAGRGDSGSDSANDSEVNHQNLIVAAPKRWVVYEPMVLLPSGSFTTGPWPALLSSLPPEQTASLWKCILHALSPSKAPLTHLAVNEGIPLHVDESHQASSLSSLSPLSTALQTPKSHPQHLDENLLRSPSGLKTLHGDFGPSSPQAQPTQADFDAAFWVSTKQNGITQTWAPRFTMFSRGNVKEKARLLSFHATHPPPPPAQDATLVPNAIPTNSHTRPKVAVDLYAGIGYFVFSYARLGLRVLCWELNPWSVEGLRRGAVANKWTVRVIQGAELSLPTPELVTGGAGAQIVVFLEDNALAEDRIAELRASGLPLDVLHVNCGFLPTSLPTFRPAWAIQRASEGDGWLHLHENVGVEDIERRRGQVQGLFDGWRKEEEGDDGTGRAVVQHVELVKTFAPGVWHCVFDVYITRSSSGSSNRCGAGRPT
ncbi:S-adenosyl-L-methionine-dependent methyltransferase [Podospora appendiculata]|uniref:S-adenosyl-L-methionine-dependent methyltransferase n=1 Tax=Podospora appendiculata TaxID=314037 RepID=A0AAE0X3D8_9PEZI|nr:S-adenosyl-L-methionine-dependent methyltransferase [Podospora appendiculata]